MNNRISKAVAVATIIVLGPAVAISAPTQWADNKNSYEVIVAPGITWAAANAAANAATHRGAQGHLATITTAAEDAFIEGLRAAALTNEAWVGGIQFPCESPEVNAGCGWEWINSEGDISTSTYPLPSYSNWLPYGTGFEPNDLGGEGHLAVGLGGNFGWNDEGNLGNIGGYVIEYDNLIPVANADSANAFTNETIVIDVLGNDTLGETPNTVTISSAPTSGLTAVATVNPNNTVNYRSADGFGGTDTFQYTLTDGNGDAVVATVTVTVDPSLAVVDPGAGVTVLNCLQNNSCPFDFEYQEVVEPGELLNECCAVHDPRETEGSGRGKRLWYEPRDLDVGLLLANSPQCADVVSLLDPALYAPTVDVDGDGVLDYVPFSVLRPWQRAYPDPENPIEYGALAEVGSLQLAICVIQSSAVVDGVALLGESPQGVVGYDANCDEDDLAFRPMVAGNSVDPKEQDFPYTQPWTAECDGTRSAKRSSTNIAVLNVRNDTTQNGPKSTISRVMGDLYNEIAAAPGNSCIDDFGDVSGPLLAQWTVAKKAVEEAKGDPDKILVNVVPAIDALTLLALDTIPACADGSNPKGLIAGRSINASYMTCSYRGHPDEIYPAGKDGSTGGPGGNSCPIDPLVLDAINNP
jgi:hypothetical protein